MQDATSRAKALNQQGLGYFQQQNYQVAIDRFEEAAELNPEDPEYPNNIGICELKLGRPAEARDLFEKSIRLGPSVDTYHANLGLALLHLNKPADAAPHFEKAVALNKQNGFAWSQLGLARYASNQKAAAEKAWIEAASLGDDAEVENNLGMIYMESDRLEEAEKRFRKAALLNPSYAMPLFNLGVLYQQKKGDLKQGASFYEQAIGRDPANYLALMNLGITYKKMGNIPAARRNLEAFLKLAPPELAAQINDARQMLRELR